MESPYIFRQAATYGMYNRFAFVFVLLAQAAAVGLRTAGADEASDQFAVAAAHYSHQRWALAAREFKSFLDRHPDLEDPDHEHAARATFFLGEALIQLGKFDEARLRFLDFLARHPQHANAPRALFRAGEAAYLSGRHEDAKRDLDRFQRENPENGMNAYVWSYLGDIAIRKKDLPAARDAFRGGLRQFSDAALQAKYQIGLARVFERESKFPKATAIYRTLAAEPTGALAGKSQFLLGTLYYAAGDYENAEAALREFESTFRDDLFRAKARLNRGWSLYQLGQFEQAAELFANIGEDASVRVAGRYGLGVALAATGDCTQAAKKLIASASLNPEHSLAPAMRYQAGYALRKDHQNAAAREQFDAVLERYPRSEWADDSTLAKVGMARADEDHAAVRALVAQFKQRFPESDLAAEVEQILGRSHLDQKQYTKAAVTLQSSIDQSGDPARQRQSRYLLALAERGAGRHQEAAALLARVIKTADGDLKADAQLEYASLLRVTGDPAEATELLKTYLEHRPDGESSNRARAELAICYAATETLHRAKFVYRQLTERAAGPELILPTTLHLAEAAYAAGDDRWAAELFTRLTREGTPAAYRSKGLSGLAWCQLRTEDAEAGINTFADLVQRYPDSPLAAEAALARGHALAKQNNPNGALAMYLLVVEDYPDSSQMPLALLSAARTHDRLDQDDLALASYERFLERYPEHREIDAAIYESAWILRDLKQTNDSMARFTELHENRRESPYWADATYRLAEHAFSAKQHARADKLLEAVLAAKAETDVNQHALYLQGQVAAAQQRWDRVEIVFSRLLQESPSSHLRIPAMYWIAEATYRDGDYDEAGRRFAELAKKTERRRDAWLAMIPLRRAQVLAQQKKWAEALEMARDLRSEFPKFNRLHEVHYLLGRCLASQAKLVEAREQYRQAIRDPRGRKTETAAMAQWMIGESFFHQEAYEDAIREYLKVEILYDFPRWQAGALLQAGKCHEHLGQWERVLSLYARLLEQYPQTKFTDEASRRLRVARQRVSARSL